MGGHSSLRGILSSDYDEFLGPEDRSSLEVKYVLGVCLARAEQYAEALSVFSDVRAKQEERFGPDDADTMKTTNDLATTERLASRGGW